MKRERNSSKSSPTSFSETDFSLYSQLCSNSFHSLCVSHSYKTQIIFVLNWFFYSREYKRKPFTDLNKEINTESLQLHWSVTHTHSCPDRSMKTQSSVHDTMIHSGCVLHTLNIIKADRHYMSKSKPIRSHERFSLTAVAFFCPYLLSVHVS